MIQKVSALLRYFIIKVFNPRVNIPRISFIGANSSVQSVGAGSITAKGKIRLEAFTELLSLGKLVLGHNFVMNGHSRIIAHEGIEIGDNVVIARFVTILDHDHAFSRASPSQDISFSGYITSPIRIGNNVWLGDKVSIMKGVTIGDNVIIGANAVVTKDIPANCIAAGIPAKVIKNI